MDLLAVGVVTATHGVGGEIKVRSYSGAVDHLMSLSDAAFKKGAVQRRLRLQSVRPGPGGVIVKIQGVDAPGQARALVGFEIWVDRSRAAPLSKGEYYAADLCRCSVWFGEEHIGPVRSVLDAGPTQMLEVGTRGGGTALVPFTSHFVGEVDLAAKRISLRVDEIVR